MRYLTYSGNELVRADLPATASVLYAPPVLPGIPRGGIADAARQALLHPLGMDPLTALVGPGSRVLIAFDDNCQPFPPMRRPDIRQTLIEVTLELLYRAGVAKKDIELVCAVALHRKMKRFELAAMVGRRVMAEFYPAQLRNFDAEDPDDIVVLEPTDLGEVVETSRSVVESDLVIYLDTVQIPLNGGHKSVAVGLGTYNSIASHHSPHMTDSSPHVMQPEGSAMHASIERISRVISRHTRILVLEAAMNGATYPAHLSHLGKPDSACSVLERALKRLTPIAMKALPEPVRRSIFAGIPSDYSPLAIHAGAIDEVHPRTLAALERQVLVKDHREFSTMVFGLADLSPYAVGARINPVLVLSDVLGYIFNWFYGAPFVRKGGSVIVMNPVLEVFHPEYHAAYRRFWDEVLPETTEPFAMQKRFQERFARDPELIDAYRNRFAHHGFHPFTVWYWATYALKNLAAVILVGPPNDHAARRLGVSWAPSLEAALARAREVTGGDDVVALTIPPFFYLDRR